VRERWTACWRGMNVFAQVKVEVACRGQSTLKVEFESPGQRLSGEVGAYQARLRKIV
jgi:hypothetical protein